MRIENAGGDIRSTDYWDTDHARRGLAFLSINRGTVRLLLPDSIAEDVLSAARVAQGVVLSRGPWSEEGGRDAIEILFDDGSATPFAMHMDARQADRLWSSRDQGRELPVALWIRGGRRPTCALNLPGRVMVVDSVPTTGRGAESV